LIPPILVRFNSRKFRKNPKIENKPAPVLVLVKSCLPTVEWQPTLSAERKILVAAKAAHYRRPQSFGDTVLTDRGFATEIAQFTLGDLHQAQDALGNDKSQCPAAHQLGSGRFQKSQLKPLFIPVTVVM
jgi:hypothetical protein